MLRFLVFLLSALWATAGACTPTLLTPAAPVVWRDFLGVNAHFLWFSPEQYRIQMDRLKDLGLEWVRVDLHWDRHEITEGNYRLGELDELAADMHKHDLKSVVYVVGSARHATSAPSKSTVPDQFPPTNPDTYAQFMQLLVKRYPHVDAWQIWNEPNLPSFWRPHENPERYAILLQAGTLAVRSVNPDVPVVMAGMAYYSQMPVVGGLMFEALGKIGVPQLNTIAAYHPYATYPEGNQPDASDFLVHGNHLNSILRNSNVPGIWSTEWGWSSYAGPKEEQPIIGKSGQADYVLRRLALMSTMDYDKVFLFALSDLDHRATARDQYYGLLDLNGQPKPVYHALQNFLETAGKRLEPGELPDITAAPANLYAISWQREDGKQLLIFWGADEGMMELQGIPQAEVHDPLTGSATSVKAHENGLSVAVKPGVQMLVWEKRDGP